MIHEYIQAAMECASYELIDDEEPYYGEVPQLQGVWATGKSLEACRRNLAHRLKPRSATRPVRECKREHQWKQAVHGGVIQP